MTKTFSKRIAIGSDHIEYARKNDIIAFPKELGIECLDFGAFSIDRTDYPLYAEKVIRAIIA